MGGQVGYTTKFHLYTFYASSCARRLRIALELKELRVIYHYIDMQNDEHESEEFRLINPSAAIPAFVIESIRRRTGESTKTVITQSIAILEYIEEMWPNRYPLLPPPSETIRRARVRELTHIICSDIFPPTNSRISERVRAIRNSKDDQKAFRTRIANEGFQAYEDFLERYFKDAKYSCGEEVTMADVCLIPQVEQARFWGMDFSKWPQLSGVIARLEEIEEFKRTGHEYQEDTPENLRKTDLRTTEEKESEVQGEDLIGVIVK